MHRMQTGQVDRTWISNQEDWPGRGVIGAQSFVLLEGAAEFGVRDRQHAVRDAGLLQLLIEGRQAV